MIYSVETAKFFLTRKITPLKSETKEELGFGKLDPLLQDKEISLIKCEGKGIPIKVAKNERMVSTDIILENSEIEGIIKRFSFLSGKKISEPFFTAQFKNLKLVAINSKNLGVRFIISKI
ncbi:MAG: hypothetical protein NZ889_00990 [Candidatus Pacearchaeota archaeon]|nr:hypothetical protein [Candidatus Pacearchaeota archaeon]